MAAGKDGPFAMAVLDAHGEALHDYPGV